MPRPTTGAAIAEALTDATEAMLAPTSNPYPPEDDLRRALREWTFSDLIRSRQPATRPTWHPLSAG